MDNILAWLAHKDCIREERQYGGGYACVVRGSMSDSIGRGRM